MSSEGRIRDDLGAINHWLAVTRLRAAALVFLLATVLWSLGEPIDLGSACVVLAALALFSLWALNFRRRGVSELSFFYAQHVIDLTAITIGIAASAEGPLALLLRPLFALVVIPASLVSVPSGVVAATGATLGHEVLLGLEQGFSVSTLLSLDSLAPAFLFFLVAQQCFFYGAHLEQKNEELAHLADRLDDIALRNAELLEEARQASALKSEFVSTMSHELRTPLNVILGYTEILRDEAKESPTEVQSLLGRIDTCGRELLELVDATLQVGRLEAGAIKIQRESVTVRELMDALTASTAGLPKPTDVSLVWDCQAIPNGSIDTDRAKVALIVRNLVSNALKFTPRGSVRVCVRGHAESLEIEVRDTGVGVPSDKLPLIFEMFRQVEPSGGSQSGVGLGLYIVDQLVRRLDGTIEVESSPGEGTSFVVQLPRYRERLAEASASERHA